MRERSSELGYTIWFTLLTLLVVAILSFGGLAIRRYTLPAWFGIQREAVQESKSFVDSTNSNLANLKTEYTRLQAKIAESEKGESIAAYEAQQDMVIDQMCIVVKTMNGNNVDYTINTFLAEHGGC